MINSQGYERRVIQIGDWEVAIVSYQLGERFIAKVDNISPGSIIGRARGASRLEAEGEAIAQAETRLEATQKLSDSRQDLQKLRLEMQQLSADLNIENE